VRFDGGHVLETKDLDASLKVGVEGHFLALVGGGSPVGKDGLDGSVHGLDLSERTWIVRAILATYKLRLDHGAYIIESPD
jgi:hypothetical protein